MARWRPLLMAQETQIEILIIIPLLIQLIGLAFVAQIDPYIKGTRQRIMQIIVAAVFLLLVRDIVAHQLDLIGTMPYARTLCAIWGYILRPVLIVLYLYIVNPTGRYAVPWTLAIVNAALYLTATFSGIVFSIDENNTFHRGPLGYAGHIVGILLLLYTLRLTIREYGKKRTVENVIPLSICAMIIIAIVMDSVVDYRKYPVTYVTIIVASANIFYYIWLHLQFARAHERDLLAEQRIRTLMAQIKPHFIYNSLTLIRSYLDEPDKAEEVLNNFASFLRGSIDMLEETENIRAETEFATVESYLYLSKERFGDHLTVERDIRDAGFFLPAFTVQSLVENAIHHGVRRNPSGRGTVRIRSFQTKEGHIIEVEDDGPGFAEEVQTAEQGADRTHIGISNVRERLELMCKGTLEIESAPGGGTIARVRIPKGGGRG